MALESDAMEPAFRDNVANRAAQLSYLAEDKELVELIWKISALPEDSRMIVKMMVQHLSRVAKASKAA